MKIDWTIKTTTMMNTRKLLWTIAILFLGALSIQAQGWERQYKLDDHPSRLSFMHQTADDHHICIGYSTDPTNDQFYHNLMKINAVGDTIWTTKFPSVGVLKGSTLTNDGGIVTASTDGSFPSTPSVHIQKFDADGNTEWIQTHSRWLGSITNANDGGFFMVANHGIQVSNQPDTIHLKKIDPTGNLLWSKSYPGIESELSSRVIQLPNDQVLIAGYTSTWGSRDLLFVKTDGNGDLIWKVQYPESNIYLTRKMILTASNDLLLIGNSSVEKYDNLGNFIWGKTFEGKSMRDIHELPNGNLAITTYPTASTEFVTLHLTDPQGEEIWTKTIIKPFITLERPLLNLTSDNGFLLGTTAITQVPEQDTFSYLFKLDSLGNIYSNHIFGQVRNDENDNCLTDSTESAMNNWIVSAANEEQTFYGVVDPNGGYEINLDTGNYLVNVLEPFDYWSPCIDSISQQVNPFDSIEIDFAMQGIVDCPLLTVDISAPFIRRCANNSYYLNYCNYGTISAEDAYVEVQFDDEFQIDSASVMWSSVSDNTYTFDLGDIAINECGSFEIYTTLDPSCDSTILGETHCVEAHIFPDSICVWDEDWDESSIEVTAECIGDSLHFYIKNIGTSTMSEALEYIVIEDNIMRDDGNFTLAPQQIKELVFEATGTTMRLQTEQADGHPGYSMPNVTIEGCDPDGDGNFSIGFFTQLPVDDANPFLSIDCQENVGSFDPNDKMAFPKGIDEEHYILANTDIKYKIRFQNVGTADAIKVVVTDTLSPLLDISTLQLGASSFPYRFELLPNNVLQFTFDDINLPPEATNEAESHGFLQYRISQHPNLPVGTVINNTAQIFFDNNSPIVTNTTYHEITEDLVQILLNTPNNPQANATQINVYPNPFSKSTQLTIRSDQQSSSKYTLQIFNITGQVIRTEQFNEQQYQLDRKNLSAGMYFFRIENQGAEVATGKIIVK